MLGGADNPNGELPSYITGADMRTVLVAELYEITVTSVPAYPDSGVDLARRSLYEQHPEKMPRADNRRWWADLAGV